MKYEKSKFSFTVCQKFNVRIIYIYIPNVKTVVIVLLQKVRNKIALAEIFLKKMFSNQELILKIDGSFVQKNGNGDGLEIWETIKQVIFDY